MKASTITTVIAILVVVGGLVWYQNQTPEPSDQTATTTASTSTVPNDWSEHNAGSLSFLHPSSAEVSTEAGRIKIQILGENNEPNTEVTDGITAYISTTTSPTSLEVAADRLFTERSETSQEVVSQVASSTFAGKTGYAFQLRNQLGSVTDYHVLPLTADQAYVISYTASGSDSDSYVDTFTTIVSSLTYDDSVSDDSRATSTPDDTSDSEQNSLAQACQQAGGDWLAEHNECEGVVGNEGESWCTSRGGSYNDCASACRHNPDADFCTQQCVFVCSF